jgi:hypothetical protein
VARPEEKVRGEERLPEAAATRSVPNENAAREPDTVVAERPVPPTTPGKATNENKLETEIA